MHFVYVKCRRLVMSAESNLTNVTFVFVSFSDVGCAIVTESQLNVKCDMVNISEAIMNICGHTLSKRVMFPLILLGLAAVLAVVEMSLEVSVILVREDVEVGVVVRWPYGRPSDINLTTGEDTVTVAYCDYWTVVLWLPLVCIILDLLLVFVHVVKYKNILAATLLLVWAIIELVVVLVVKLTFWQYLSHYFAPYTSGEQNIMFPIF